MTGPQRDSGHHLTLICATRRFVDWRVSEATNPIAIYELRSNGLGWNGLPEEEPVMQRIADFMN